MRFVAIVGHLHTGAIVLKPNIRLPTVRVETRKLMESLWDIG